MQSTSDDKFVELAEKDDMRHAYDLKNGFKYDNKTEKLKAKRMRRAANKVAQTTLK